MNNKLRIALLVPWLKSKGGIERAILRLLHDKQYDIDLYTLNYEKADTFEEFKKYKVHQLGNAKTGGFFRKGANLFTSMLMSRIKDLDKYDIFMISTAGIAEFAVFRNRHPVTVALTHTPLRVAHSMYDYYRDSSLKYRVLLPIFVPIYRLFERRAWKHISYAIVYSEEVKRRLVDYGLISSQKVFKIGPHVDQVKRGRTKTDKIIFYPSRFTPYKRQDLAVRAFMKSSLPSLGFKLVVAGFVENKHYFKDIEALAYGREDISIKSDLSEKELKELYRTCYATLFLAVNEDTGLIPLESLAYGKPVIAVNEGGPKEFVKDEVDGLLVEATETSVTDALDKITNRKYYSKLRRNALRSPSYDEKRMLRNFDYAVDTIVREKLVDQPPN